MSLVLKETRGAVLIGKLSAYRHSIHGTVVIGYIHSMVYKEGLLLVAIEQASIQYTLTLTYSTYIRLFILYTNLL